MVLVHLLPTIGGLVLSLQEAQHLHVRAAVRRAVGGARELPRDPLRQPTTRCTRASSARSRTPWSTRSGPSALTLGGGLAVALLLNRPMRGQRRRAHADADAVDRAELRRRGALAVHVAERRRDRQQGPRRLHAHPAPTGRSGCSGRNTMWAIIIPSVWRGLPFAMLIFLAGLQAMPHGAARGGGDRRRRPVAPLPLHHAAAAAAADRRPAAVRRHLRGLPVRDPVHDARLQPGPGRRPDDDPDRTGSRSPTTCSASAPRPRRC